MGNATKPSIYLNWTDGSPSKVVQPPSAQLLSGWTSGQPLPFQYLNWQIWLLDQWIQYLDQVTNSEASLINTMPQVRLINGGNWSWALGTSTLAWASAFNIAVPSIADADNQAAAGSITLADGAVAYVNANIPFTVASTTTNSSNQVGVAYTDGIVVGQSVTGTGIPGSTTVTAINTGTNTLTISNNATASGSPNLTFSGSGALTVLSAAESSLSVGPTTIIIARRVGNNVIIGVNSGQMLLHDQETSVLLGHGYTVFYSVTAGESLTANQAVYISQGEGGRTVGSAYRLDASVANGAGRSKFAGFVVTSASASATVNLVAGGRLPGFTLTAGLEYYADPATLGGITSTRPTTLGQYVAPVGFAINATTLSVDPSLAGDSNPTVLAESATFTTGENISINQAVYISTGAGVDSGRTQGDAYRTDAGITNGGVRSAFVGFATATVSSGSSLVVASSGVLSGFTSLTPGAVYYLDPTTLGAITATRPTTSNQFIAPIGIALSATQIFIDATAPSQIVAAVGVGIGAAGQVTVDPGTQSPYSLTTGNNGQILVTRSANGAIQYNLPNPATVGQFIFTIKDRDGSFGASPATLHRFGSEKIGNLAADYVMSANSGEWTFTTDNTDWIITAR